MPANTDGQSRRRRQAYLSALTSGVYLLISAAVLLWLRSRYWPQGGFGIFLAGMAAVEAALLIPLGVSLKQRLHEIEGGEEDEACNY